MTKVLLSLGSNLKNPKMQIEQALSTLADHFESFTASDLYATEPVGMGAAEDFINAACLIETDYSPGELMDILLQREREAGRERDPQGAARTSRSLDLDIILYGEKVMSTNAVSIPHPRFRERRFVLQPAAEICPAMRDPVSGLSLATLLEMCPDHHRVVKLETRSTPV